MSSKENHPQQEPPTRPLQQPRQRNKLFYRIGEVSRITGLETYVLRYWETEFPHLKPEKAGSGQRLYTQKDLEHIQRIKRLLYEDGYTISGAKRKLQGRQQQDIDAVIETVKKQLKELIDLLQ